MKDFKEILWEDLLAMEEGTIIKDWFDEGVRCIIVRGPSSLCAYVGIPSSHPLSGFDYDEVPIRCHDGLTFSGEGDKYRPEGYYWYGWDYGHSEDYAFYYDTILKKKEGKDKKWLPIYIECDCKIPSNNNTPLTLLEEMAAELYPYGEDDTNIEQIFIDRSRCGFIRGYERGKNDAEEFITIDHDDDNSFPSSFEVVILLLENGNSYIGYRVEYSEFRGDDEYEVLIPKGGVQIVPCEQVKMWKEINLPSPPKE